MTVRDDAMAAVHWLEAWRTSLVLLLLALALGWLARRVLYKRLETLAGRTTSAWDDRLVAASRGLWLPAIVLFALAPAARAAPIRPELAQLGSRLAGSALLALLVVFAARLVGSALASSRSDAEAPPRPVLIDQAIRGAILVAGGLFVADNLGLEIGTLLTALGVGSLALGLALQPTLTNLFAGLHLSAAQPIRVGDFIELEDGTQGIVTEIGWRATRLRQLANNLVEIPNSRLAEMRLVNYSLPDGPQAVLVQAGVAYGSDLERVELVTVDVARAVQRELAEADPEHEPFVRFHTFGDSSVDFTVILRARVYTDRWPLIHAFLKRLKARFDEERIEIPFPQRVVHSPGRSA